MGDVVARVSENIENPGGHERREDERQHDPVRNDSPGARAKVPGRFEERWGMRSSPA